jgi:hypothetical protein
MCFRCIREVLTSYHILEFTDWAVADETGFVFGIVAVIVDIL